MPFVTQVTFVRSGNLAVRMKGPDDTEPYILPLAAGQAVLTEPGAFFQLLNEGSERCDVLYVVSPAYVFELSPKGGVRYDDSLVLDEDWDHLTAARSQSAQAMPTLSQREEAVRRLWATKKKGPES
jgi:hypothetical protein